jgi:hypothetical protein
VVNTCAFVSELHKSRCSLNARLCYILRLINIKIFIFYTIDGSVITASKLQIVTCRRDHFRQNCHCRMAAECQVGLIGLSLQGHARKHDGSAIFAFSFLFLCDFLASLVLGIRNCTELRAQST